MYLFRLVYQKSHLHTYEKGSYEKRPIETHLYIQITTEKQFVTNPETYRQAGDTATFIPFLKDFQEIYHRQSLIQ